MDGESLTLYSPKAFPVCCGVTSPWFDNVFSTMIFVCAQDLSCWKKLPPTSDPKRRLNTSEGNLASLTVYFHICHEDIQMGTQIITGMYKLLATSSTMHHIHTYILYTFTGVWKGSFATLDADAFEIENLTFWHWKAKKGQQHDLWQNKFGNINIRHQPRPSSTPTPSLHFQTAVVYTAWLLFHQFNPSHLWGSRPSVAST